MAAFEQKRVTPRSVNEPAKAALLGEERSATLPVSLFNLNRFIYFTFDSTKTRSFSRADKRGRSLLSEQETLASFTPFTLFQDTNCVLTDRVCAFLLLTVGKRALALQEQDKRPSYDFIMLTHHPPASFGMAAFRAFISLEGNTAGGDWMGQYFVTYLQVQSSDADNIDEH